MLAVMSQRQVDPFLNLNSGASTLSDICLFIQFDGARIYEWCQFCTISSCYLKVTAPILLEIILIMEVVYRSVP